MIFFIVAYPDAFGKPFFSFHGWDLPMVRVHRSIKIYVFSDNQAVEFSAALCYNKDACREREARGEQGPRDAMGLRDAGLALSGID